MVRIRYSLKLRRMVRVFYVTYEYALTYTAGTVSALPQIKRFLCHGKLLILCHTLLCTGVARAALFRLHAVYRNFERDLVLLRARRANVINVIL